MFLQKRSIFRKVIERLTQLSYSALLGLWVSLAVIFATGYFVLGVFIPEHGPTQLINDPSALVMFFDSLYYSIITATSTGYGDIVPQGFSKALASLQSILALLIWAIFVTKLVSHKQEAAIREVHKLTFEDVFHNIREGLYIMRKDFDRITKDAQENKSLSKDHWMDMVIAYRQGQTLLQNIPDFYANDDQHMYTIDHQREQLLHESVNRTLHRLNDMLNTLSQCDIDWVSDEESMTELKNLLGTVDAVTPTWQKESPYTEAFEDILHLHSKIEEQVKSAVPEIREEEE